MSKFNFEECSNCFAKDCIVNHNNNKICNECGCVLEIDVYVNEYSYKEYSHIKRIFYKRTNYLVDLINKINGHVNYMQYMDFDLYEHVKNQIETKNIQVNYKNIRKIIKQQKKGAQYRFIYVMLKWLKHEHNELITYNQRTLIMNEFIEIEKIFMSINKASEFISNKIKFLNYTFVLHHIFQYLGYTYMLDYLNYPLVNKSLMKKYRTLWDYKIKPILLR